MTRYAENNRALAEDLPKLEPMLTTEEDKRLSAELQQASDKYHSIMDRAVELGRAGKKSAAIELVYSPDSEAVSAELLKTIQDFLESQDKQKEGRRQQAAAESRVIILTIVLGLAGLVLGVLFAIFIGRSVAGGISRMVAMTQEVAANNLAVEDMTVDSGDELGEAATALNSMKNNLSAIMQSIASTAEHVASASEEISANATQTANGSETQKDQVHQIATAMQEMSASPRAATRPPNPRTRLRRPRARAA
jgi:methyl-accepting chemotaxis protein